MRPNRTLCIAIIVLLFSVIQQQQNQLLAFVLLMERWINSCNRLLAASLRARNRRFRQLRRAPYAWSLPRLNGSWFEIHYHDLFIFIFWPLRHTRAQNDIFWQHRMRFPLFEKNLAKSASPTQAHRRLWWFSQILKFFEKRKRWVALENACVDRF